MPRAAARTYNAFIKRNSRNLTGQAVSALARILSEARQSLSGQKETIVVTDSSVHSSAFAAVGDPDDTGPQLAAEQS